MADRQYDPQFNSEYFADLRAKDLANRAKKSERKQSKFVTEPDVPVVLESKERGWDVSYPTKHAGDELMGKGAVDAMSVQRPRRPDQITRTKTGEEDSAR